MQHSLRNLRRDNIVESVYRLADSGKKICFVTSEKSKRFLTDHENIDFLFDLDWHKEVMPLAKQTRYLICQTPLHTSILNERFVVAMQSGCVPLVEAYPQYLRHVPRQYVFDYGEKTIEKIYSCIEENKIARDWSIMKETLSREHSEEVVRGTMLSYAKKYAMTGR